MNLFERLAIDYNMFAAQFSAYNVMLVYLSALLFGLLKKVSLRMQRGTYFLNSAIIIFLASLSQCIWFISVNAMAGGYLFLLVVLDIIIWIIVGYALVTIAKSRSNDVYGHSRKAVYAFIPIVNFVLLFTPSKDGNVMKVPGLMSGVSAVIFGLVLTVAGRGISVVTEETINSYIENSSAGELGFVIRDKMISYHVASGGLSDAFEYIKSLEAIGTELDEITILEDIEFTDNTLTYKFFITDNQITSITQEMRNQWEKSICDTNTIILQEGATVAFHHYSDANPMISYVFGTSSICSM